MLHQTQSEHSANSMHSVPHSATPSSTGYTPVIRIKETKLIDTKLTEGFLKREKRVELFPCAASILVHSFELCRRCPFLEVTSDLRGVTQLDSYTVT